MGGDEIDLCFQKACKMFKRCNHTARVRADGRRRGSVQEELRGAGLEKSNYNTQDRAGMDRHGLGGQMQQAGTG